MSGALEDPWFVYVVRCADGSLYTGIARDVPKRIAQHDAGKGAKYTRGRGPLELVTQSPALERGAALRLEARAKRLKGEVKLAAVRAGPPPEARRKAAKAAEAAEAAKPRAKVRVAEGAKPRAEAKPRAKAPKPRAEATVAKAKAPRAEAKAPKRRAPRARAAAQPSSGGGPPVLAT